MWNVSVYEESMSRDQISFDGKAAVIVCHDSMPGPPHETLRDYLLKEHIQSLLFIGHKNRYVQGNPIQESYCKLFIDGKKVKDIRAAQFHGSEYVQYIRDFLLTVYWVIRYTPKRVHFFIGLANMNALAGLLLKMTGRVDRVVYYVIDYVPQRFSHAVINYVYHWLDALCAQYSDVTWNYGKGMIRAREERWKKTFPHQLHTPHGVELQDDILLAAKNYHRYQLVYMGTLYEQQGLQLIIDALPKIRLKIPEIQLKIIGLGPYEKQIRQQIKTLKVQKFVTFEGFISDVHNVDTIVAQSALGIATYKNDIGFVIYTEPGKVKRYLSCSVPVIITEGTPLADDIDRSECGLVIPYKSEEAADAILSLLSNKKNLEEMRKKAYNYVRQFTWNRIYSDAFSSVMNNNL